MKGERVWMVDHPLYGWTPAVVVSLSSNTNLRLITIKSQDNVERVVDARSVIKFEEDTIDYNDLVVVQNLHEGILVHNIWQRYEKKKIYTWIGDILVCVNPIKILPELYTPSMLSSAPNLSVPHIYGTAAKAYRTMVQTSRPQVFLVSGESGSGKTESCKLIIQYLVHASAGGSANTSKSESIQNMILASSPILESFGNAKTKRNSNSSRFGKFFKIHFDNNGAMMGATISQFLLEKGRVVQPPPGELSYAIFYTLVLGCDTPYRRTLGLNPGVHNYKLLHSNLNQQVTSAMDPVLESTNFRAIVASFTALGLQNDIQFVFEVLAAILHLGNVVFEVHPHGGSAVVDNRPLQAASLLLLGPSAERLALETALTTQLVNAGANRKRGSVTRRLLEPHQSSQSRDALCKALYESLFDHICSLINSALLPNKGVDSNSSANNRFIGILDIFGFENMDSNRYDQLLINYANEVLQLQFANQVILTEQQEYQKEKIPWTKVDFTSNQNCVDLLEKKPKGILAMLEEECMLPQGSDKRLLQKLHETHDKNTDYTKPRLASDTQFGVRHYAGDVTYNIDGFVEQNRDDIHVDLVFLLVNSAKQGVAKLGNRIQAGKKASTGASSSISSQFRSSLSNLLRDIGQTQPNHKYYIRCVKPNHDNTSATFDPLFALRQMRAMGMLESIRVRKMGFSLRITHQEFIDRFGCIIGTIGNATTPAKTVCSQFLAKVLPPESGQTLWFLGANKIFLKEKLVGTLEEMRYKAEKQREEEELKRKEEELKKKRAEEERLRREEEERKRAQAELEKKKEEERRRHEEEVKRKKELLLQEEMRLKEEIRLKEERAKEQQKEKAKQEEKRLAEGAKVPYLEAAKRGSLVHETPHSDTAPHSNHQTPHSNQQIPHTNHQTPHSSHQPHNQSPRANNQVSHANHANPQIPSSNQKISDNSGSLVPQKKPTQNPVANSVRNTKQIPEKTTAPRPTSPLPQKLAGAENNLANSINININNDTTTPINININIISNEVPSGSQLNIGITQQPTLTGTLPELLATPAFFGVFEEFMKGKPDAALLEFWKDIQVYKKAAERLLSGQVRGIYNKYFGHGSKFVLNLDKKLLADVKDKIMYRNPEYTTFARVEASILHSLATTHIPQFRSYANAPQFILADTPSAASTSVNASRSVPTFAAAKVSVLPKSQSQSAIVLPTTSSPSLLARAAARVTIGRTENTTDSRTTLTVVTAAPPKELTLAEKAAIQFNEAPKKGLEFMAANSLIQPNSATDIAKFFKTTPSVDKTVLGDFIGRRDELNVQVLGEFLATFQFQGLDFDLALREFLGWFRLPGESQMIERIVEQFSKRYCESNTVSTFFASPEAAFILSYSIIMLATDLHNVNVKVKMTREQWIKNNSGCNGGGDFDLVFLKKIYERIAKAPFASTAPKPALQKEPPSPRSSTPTSPRGESKFPLLRRGTKQPVGK